MNYLARTGYETVGQLHTRVEELQEQAKPLLAERKKLYRKSGNEAEIAAMNEQLRPVWAEIYLCRDIEKHSMEIQKKLRDIDEARRFRSANRHERQSHMTKGY